MMMTKKRTSSLLRNQAYQDYQVPLFFHRSQVKSQACLSYLHHQFLSQWRHLQLFHLRVKRNLLHCSKMMMRMRMKMEDSLVSRNPNLNRLLQSRLNRKSQSITYSVAMMTMKKRTLLLSRSQSLSYPCPCLKPNLSPLQHSNKRSLTCLTLWYQMIMTQVSNYLLLSAKLRPLFPFLHRRNQLLTFSMRTMKMKKNCLSLLLSPFHFPYPHLNNNNNYPLPL